jgi:hypothetical protein
MKIVFSIIISFVLFSLLVALEAYVVSDIWSMYMVAQFGNAPSFAALFGACSIFSMISYRPPSREQEIANEENPSYETAKVVVYGVFATLTTWACCWLAHFFVT